MGKFRSKMKGQTKGKRWLKGQSSNSNPKTQKYREMAKSRFFQENLGLYFFIFIFKIGTITNLTAYYIVKIPALCP